MDQANVKLTADGSQAIREIKRVGDTVDGLSSRFEQLKTVVASLGLVSVISQLSRYATQITSISQATDLSVQTVKNFSTAVSQAGGDGVQAAQDLGEFTKKISEAISGNTEAIRSFSRVGVSLQDLVKLDNEGILKKTLKGLADTKDSAAQAKVSMSLLGNEFKKVSAEQAATKFEQLQLPGISTTDNTAAIESLSNAQKNLKDTFTKVGDEVIRAIKPISDFVAEIKISHDQIRSAIETFKKFLEIVIEIGTFFAGGLIAKAIQGVARSIGGLALAAETASVSIAKSFSSSRVLDGFKGYAGELSRRASGILSKGFASLGVTVNKSGQEVLTYVTGPLAKFITSIRNASDAIGNFTTYIGSSTVFKVFAGAIAGIAFNFREFFERIWTGVGTLTDFERTLHAMINSVSKGWRSLKQLTGAFGDLVASMLKVPLDILGKIFDIDLVKQFTSTVKEAATAVGDFFTNRDSTAGAGRGGGYTREHEEERRRQEEIDKKRRDKLAAAADKQKELARALKQFSDQQANIVTQYKFQGAETLRNLSLETDLLKVSEEEAEIRRAINAEYTRYGQQVQQLQQQLQQLTPEQLQQGQGKVISDTIAKLEESYANLVPSIVSAVQAQQAARRELAATQLQLEHIQNTIDRQNAAGEQFTQTFLDISRAISDSKFEQLLQTMTPLQQETAKINRELELQANLFSTALTEALENGSITYTEYEQRLAALNNRLAELRGQLQSTVESARSWDTGWQQAVNNFVDSTSNLAVVAQQQFDAVFGNMSRALDNFVETGKFKFKDLVGSILKDLLKLELKKSFTNLMNTSGGFSGIASGILKMFSGRAAGGPVAAGTPYMVGERGPELFMPKSAGTIVPNHQLAAMGSGGGTTVTNNITIQAIDTQSVAQFFANNRRMLLGATEQARKELPIRNRF